MAKVLIPIALAIFFVAAAVQGGAVPDDLKEPGKVAHAACVTETGVTEDLIEKTGKGEFEDDEKLGCYFKCIFEKFMLIKDNDIDFVAMLAVVPEAMKETVTHSIKICREKTGKDLCEKSLNVSRCLYELDPEGYFVV